MTTEDDLATTEIREIFESAIKAGLKREAVAGASDPEIDLIVESQHVAKIPAAAREVFRLVGKTPGLWLSGSSFGTRFDYAELKSQAVANLSRVEGPLADVESLVVLAQHAGYEHHIIDGADLDKPNPRVWLYVAGGDPRPQWNTVTDWFRAITPDVRYYREELEMLLEDGETDLPDWSQDIQL